MRTYDFEGTVTGESLCYQYNEKVWIRKESQVWRGKLYFYKVGYWYELEKDKDRSVKLKKLKKR